MSFQHNTDDTVSRALRPKVWSDEPAPANLHLLSTAELKTRLKGIQQFSSAVTPGL